MGKLPIAGKIISSYALVVFMRSCGSLIEGGIPAAQAYEDTARTIPFLPFRLLFQKHAPHIRTGIPLSRAFIGNAKIPRFISPLLGAGELSGKLGESLIRAAAILDRDIEHALKHMTALIEPVMMAGMGCVVGAIALSIMMPIYDISRVLQH